MTEIARPSMTDDSGALTDGTEIDKAFMDAIMDEIDTQCHSATNPTVTPADTTDEVVAARGSKADLDTRLDVALNEDGTLKTQASLVSNADAAELPMGNLIINDTFLIWAGGDSAEATCWTVAGGGAAVARAGTGLADTKRKVGDFCSKLTYGAATLTYYQEILDATAYSALDNLDGESVGFGAWVWASAASQARLYVADGATTSYSDSYHTGGSGWEWLSGTHDLSGSATYLRFGISVESGAANPVYLSGATVLFSEIAPTKWRPARTIYGSIVWKITGNVSTGNEKDHYVFHRPALVMDVQMYADTAPVGDNIEIQVNNASNGMFSTVPQIDDGDNGGVQAVDGTYQYRCFAGSRADAPTTINWDVDTVGSGTAGADLYVMVRCLVYPDPFEGYLAALPDKAV
jgi:hypothetical protein